LGEEETFIDDAKVSTETRVCYSVGKRVLAQPLYVLMISAGLFPFVSNKICPIDLKGIGLILSCALFSLIGVILTWQNLKQLLNRTPQIIISDDGLILADQPFHSWSVISDLHIVPRGPGTRIKYYLQYNAPKMFDIELDSFDMSHDKLRQRLQLHRSRFIFRHTKSNNKKI